MRDDAKDHQKYSKLKARRFKGWLFEAYFSRGQQGLFGWKRHTLATLGARLATARPGVSTHHLALIGDSHTRKRYLALVKLLGKPVDELEVRSLP